MARRTGLREFQLSVAERLRTAATRAALSSKLGFQVAGVSWFVSLHQVSEVIPMPPFIPVPLTQPWFRGVANVRGNLYSIVDFGVFMGGAATSQEGPSRVLLAGQKFAFNAGLLVSRVLGLRNIAGWQCYEQDGEVRLRDANGQMWRKLDMAKLLHQPEFLLIGT